MPRPAIRLTVWLGAVALALAWARPAAAQTTVWTDAPLSDVLYSLADQTGLDLVFAARVVRERRVSGRYTAGEDAPAALARLLRGTGIRAQPLRAGQYVLIAEPLNVTYGGDQQPEALLGTLEGRAVDAETGDPLPGASVFLVDARIGALAGSDGGFAVPNLPAGRYAVRVSFIGYRPVRLDLDVFPLSPRLPVVVRLPPEPLASSEVKVDALGDEPAPGMTDMRARGVAATASPFGRGDLGSALAALPGLTRTGGAGGPVVVRGADPDALRVLRDGVPVYAPWHAGGLVLTLQPEALGRIVLHRGQAPAGVGGGLAAILETETASALAGDTVSAVALSPVAARAVANVVLSPRVSLHVGAVRSVLSRLVGPGVRLAEGGVWIVDPLGGRRGDAVRPRMAFESAEASIGVRVGRAARLDVSAWGTRDRLDLPATGARVAGDAGALTARLRGLVGQRTFATGIVYTTRVTEQAGVTADEGLGETAAALDVERSLSLSHTLSVGGRAAWRRVETGEDADRRAADEVGVYVADTWSPVRPWQVQAGLRLNAASGTAAVLSPRVFVRWMPVADRVVVRAGISRQVQAVQRLIRMAGPFPLAGAAWAVAGADGTPASAWQAGLGAEWAPSETIALSVDAYGRRERDVLRPDAAGDLAGPLAGFSRHAGRAAGVDVAARLVADGWTVSFAGAAALAEVCPPGGVWRPAPYARPLSAGLLAERAVGPLALGVRLDAASGRADAGRRAPADVRAGLALGAGATRRGVRFDVLAQVQVRLAGASGGEAVDPEAPLPLALDARALPAYPTLSIAARW
ncbi:MAG TPA: TonB-dependent receptor [Rubricoccaceae bacterium]|jgi:hypothetical protein